MAFQRLSLLYIVVWLSVCHCQQQPLSIDGQVEQELCPNFMHEYRLPKDVVPISYNLKLTPNLGKLSLMINNRNLHLFVIF